MPRPFIQFEINLSSSFFNDKNTMKDWRCERERVISVMVVLARNNIDHPRDLALSIIERFLWL